MGYLILDTRYSIQFNRQVRESRIENRAVFLFMFDF